MNLNMSSEKAMLNPAQLIVTASVSTTQKSVKYTDDETHRQLVKVLESSNAKKKES